MAFEDQKFKPTLDKPKSDHAVKYEKSFANKLHRDGVKLSETDMLLNEKEQSFKKKIFDLSKMEALVHGDQTLSPIYNEMAEDGDEKYGYHYNETIMNLMFNKYVMNSPKFLQKYKQAIPKEKERRDKTGIHKLQAAGELEKDMQSKREKLQKTTPHMEEDVAIHNNSLPGVVKEEPMTSGNFGVVNGFGYDQERDGNNRNQKYYDTINPEVDETTGAGSSGAYSPVAGTVNRKFVDTKDMSESKKEKTTIDEKAKSKNQQQFMGMVHAAQKGELDDPSPAVEKVAKEIDPEDAEDFASTKHKGLPEKVKTDENINEEEVDESTTSSSSGQFSTKLGTDGHGGKAKRHPMLDKPAWEGGEIIGESNYITDPSGFKKYVNEMNEFDMTDSSVPTMAEESPYSADKLKNIDTQMLGNLFIDLMKVMQKYGNVAKETGIKDDIAQIKNAIDNRPDKQNMSPEAQQAIQQGGNWFTRLFGMGEGIGEGENMNEEVGSLKTIKEIISKYNIQPSNGAKFRLNDLLPVLTNPIDKDDAYDLGRLLADKVLANYGIGWNDLGDINSIWDAVEAGHTDMKSFMGHIKELAQERVSDIDSGGMFGEANGANAFAKKMDAVGDTEKAIGNLGGGDNPYDAPEMNIDTRVDADKGKYSDKFSGNIGEAEGEEGDPSFDQEQDWGPGEITYDDIKQYKSNPDFKNIEGAYGNLLQYGARDPRRDSQKINGILGYLRTTLASMTEFSDEQIQNYYTHQASKGAASRPDDFYDVNESIIDQQPFDDRDSTSMKMKATGMGGGSDTTFGDVGGFDLGESVDIEEDVTKRVKCKSDEEPVAGKRINEPGGCKKTASAQKEKENSPTNLAARRKRMAKKEKDLEAKKGEYKKELEQNKQKMNKLKGVNEDKKPSSLVMKDRIGKENEANFKADAKNSNTKDIMDMENEMTFKDQVEEVPDNPFELGQKIEKDHLDATGGMEDGFDNVGNSANPTGDEIKKRNLSNPEQEEVQMMRYGMQDWVYDNEPSERFEERMKEDMGDELYDERQKKMKYKADAPMYNKDTQPTEDAELEKDQFDKDSSGWNQRDGTKKNKRSTVGESVLTGKYTDDYGNVKLINFKLNEAVKGDSGKRLSLEGMGNSFTNRVYENAEMRSIMDNFEFYMGDNNKVNVKKTGKQTLTESTGGARKEVNEQMEKMKKLMGYDPSVHVNTGNVKKNRNF